MAEKQIIFVLPLIACFRFQVMHNENYERKRENTALSLLLQ
jgi:hypothetical protein